MFGLSFDKIGVLHMQAKGGHYMITKEGGKYYPIPISGGGQTKRKRGESSESSAVTMADLHSLPDELLKRIIQYLDDESCEMLGQTCKRMDGITRSLRQANTALGNIGNHTLDSITQLQTPIEGMDGDERAIMIKRINTMIYNLTKALRPSSMKRARFTDPAYHAVNMSMKRAKLQYVIWVVDGNNRATHLVKLLEYLKSAIEDIKIYVEWGTPTYNELAQDKGKPTTDDQDRKWIHVNKCMIMLNYMYNELREQPRVEGYTQLLNDF
jgi:hypothetical protein